MTYLSVLYTLLSHSPTQLFRYHTSYLTAGCWSPSRAGVFFVTRMDGVIDIWDYFYRQNEVAYTHKVTSVISSIGLICLSLSLSLVSL